MRHLLVFVLMVCMVGAVSAADLGNTLPPKGDAHVLQNPVSGDRQGGDTVGDATPIPGLPYNDTGATCQYTHDYDAVCPYSGSLAPDVVYSLAIGEDTSLTVDLCGSGYDTKTYIFDENLNELACNDDFYSGDPCGSFVSLIQDAFIPGGQTVYIIVDGYSGDCGEYIIEVTGDVFVPCVIECPAGGVLEGEPPLVDGYQDLYNGGCNSLPTTPFQNIWGTGGNHVDFCGVSGWYSFQGLSYRDTDWFIVVLDEDGAGFIDCTIDALSGTFMFELFPQDCNGVAVAQQVQVIGGCNPQNMTVFGAPGDIAWLWVGPDVFAAPPGIPSEYPYLLTIDGLEDGIIATEDASWSQVKDLFK
jgi:hypothetical protein